MDFKKWHDKLDSLFNDPLTEEYHLITDDKLQDIFKALKDDAKENGMILYRYSSADYWNIRNLECQQLVLSPVGRMNDIMEGVPNDVSAQFTSVDRKALEDVMYLKCFSEDCTNELMWAHYADNSQGICVEYDLSLLDHNHPVWPWLFPVRYSDKRYLHGNIKYINKDLKCLKTAELEGSTVFEDDIFNLQDLMAIFLTKGNAWKYEKEWRILVPRHKMSFNVEDEPVFEDRTVGFHCVTAVLCGFMIDKTVKVHLHEIAERMSEKEGRNIPVKQVTLDQSNYKLQIL